MADNFKDAFRDMLTQNQELINCGIEMFRLFNIYVKAGFTEDQALKLIAHTLAAIQQNKQQ